MSVEIQTDYLIIGAGAAGMAFADEILEHSSAKITIVDRRHAPGGHWLVAYPFVRLHQPSSFYGVSSVPLGEDRIDTIGTNAGFYELAGPDEIRSYYEQVMHRHFLPTGRVQYFPSSDYVGDGRFVSRLSGESRQVRARKRVVDTTYIEGTFPATTPPPFEVGEGVRCIPVGELTRLDEQPERYVIIGAGKTATDACVWLLEQGVSPSAICWIKPREAWWINRKFQQPLTLFPELSRGIALQLEAMAKGTTIDEVFAHLEASEILLRIDSKVVPTMLHGALLGEREAELLRGIENVVRMGHVSRIDPDTIVLDTGRIPTNARTLHVHCAARALARPPKRPIFEAGRLTNQPFQWGFVCYQAAMLAILELSIESDDEKNRLCSPIHFWDESQDYLTAFMALMAGEAARAGYPKLASWSKATRLNPMGGMAAFREDPRVKETRARIKASAFPAAANLQKLLAV